MLPTLTAACWHVQGGIVLGMFAIMVGNFNIFHGLFAMVSGEIYLHWKIILQNELFIVITKSLQVIQIERPG